MQCSLVLAVLVASLAIVHAGFDNPENEKYFNECKAETGAEENFKDVIKERKIPTSDKGMCLMECLLRKNKVYDNDGKYNPEGAKEHFTKMFGDKSDVVEKAIAIAEECSKIDIEGLDKCEAAVKHLTCARTKAVQQNISLSDKHGA